MDDAGQEVSKSRNKRKNNGLENGSNRSQKAPKKGEESVSGAQNNMEKSSPSQSRKRKVLEKFVLAEMENPERLTPAGGGRNANNVFRGNRRGKGQRVGRGRGRGRLCAEQSETSSSDDIGSDDTQEYYSEKFEGQQEVRRVSLTILFLPLYFSRIMRNISNGSLDLLAFQHGLPQLLNRM